MHQLGSRSEHIIEQVGHATKTIHPWIIYFMNENDPTNSFSKDGRTIRHFLLTFLAFQCILGGLGGV